ncbi:hypothetical protein [Flavobacterium hydatis]|uniref:Uncharacterized protein n=1 Tax=Flavobacterium hydatis TaxID=991 RepID=A0A086AS34_FLAHY|nr:hypothetical protein [Flavobacterium hydatis]KFF19498.1 hypothetical protein IW20_03195 [Flavobacterium hydatis]OXA96368.1 hypothetical protein B0A62_03630 [Flavobacterium hydatis]
MKLKLTYSALLFTFTAITFGQVKPLIVEPTINLPKDTLIANNLIKSLNGFLSLKESPNKENTYVLKEDLLETSILLDEMKAIEKSGKYKDENFYKGYLNNVVQLDNDSFFIQFSYIGINENKPILGASFEILAKKRDDKFYFLSPLKRNTMTWQSKTIGNCVFHYKNTLNNKTASEYVKAVASFDAKLKPTSTKIEWYGCSDLPDLLQTIGVKYKINYNGNSSSNFNANENNTTLLVSGANNTSFNSFDPHDLWHERVRNVYPRSAINKPVDEGCAYLYGGSWGISWKDILATFKEKIASNPNSDWLTSYEDFYNFGESKEKHLLVPYVVNALIVQKIEKEKGFPAVLELLSCGKYEKGNENYFITLEKIIGINKSNYNESVWKLIKEN